MYRYMEVKRALQVKRALFEILAFLDELDDEDRLLDTFLYEIALLKYFSCTLQKIISKRNRFDIGISEQNF